MQPDEGIIDFYNCAIKQKIHIQGYLYVTNMQLIFCSQFTDKDLKKFVGSLFHRNASTEY